MQVGRLDVERMLDEMTPEQFDGWRAFATLRPFGELKRAEIAASHLAAQCVDVEVEEILRAWGFDMPIVCAEDVMDEDDTAAFVCAALGVAR